MEQKDAVAVLEVISCVEAAMQEDFPKTLQIIQGSEDQVSVAAGLVGYVRSLLMIYPQEVRDEFLVKMRQDAYQVISERTL